MLKSNKKSFALNATLLAIGGLICKIIGAVYRIPLVKLLSASGMGLYQTAFPIFTILLTITSGGIAQTISALINQDENNATRGIVNAGFWVVTLASFSLSFILYFLSPVIANIQGVVGARDCYRVLIPAIVFSGYSAVIKGYFQSKSNVTPTIIAQLIEQISKLVFGLLLASIFVKYSITNGVIGALLGVSISELLCFLFLFIRYMFRKDKETPSNIPKSYSFIRLLKTNLPLVLGGLILPLSSLVDSVSVVNILSKTIPIDFATAMYGIQTGVVATLTNLPAVFTLALGVTIVPVMCNRENNGTRVLKKGRISIKLALLVCIPLSLLLAILASNIIDFLYPSMSVDERRIASICLAISSLGIVPLGISQIYSSLLFSVGLTKLSARNLIIAVVIKCIVLVPLLNSLSIYGASISTALCYTVACLLNARSWHKLDSDFTRNIADIKLLFAGILSVLPVFLAKMFISTYFLFALSIVCMVLYLYTVIRLGALTDEEIKSIPFIHRLQKRFRSIK